MSATGEQGFTLLEILVTLAIFGLIAGIGYPAVTRMIDHAQFARAVAQTGTSLRMARALAIKSGTPVRFALGNDAHWLASGRVLGDALPHGVGAVIEPGLMTFYADGSAQPGEVRLSDGHETWSARIDANGLIS